MIRAYGSLMLPLLLANATRAAEAAPAKPAEPDVEPPPDLDPFADLGPFEPAALGWELDSSHRLPAEQRRTPEDFKCRTCGAKPGTRCRQSTLGRYEQHRERAELARINNNRRYTGQPDYEEPSR